MSTDNSLLKVTPNHIHELSSQSQTNFLVQSCPSLSSQPQSLLQPLSQLQPAPNTSSGLRMAYTSTPSPQLARPYDSVSYVRIRRHGMRITGVSLGVPLTERTRPYTLCFIGSIPHVAPSTASAATPAAGETLACDVRSDRDVAAGRSSSGENICNVLIGGALMSPECAASPSISFALSPNSDAGTLTNTAATTPYSTAPVSPQIAANVASCSLSSGDECAGLTAGGTGISSFTSSTSARERQVIDDEDHQTRSGERSEGGGDSTSASTSICDVDNCRGRNREPRERPEAVSDSGRTSVVSTGECNEPKLETVTSNTYALDGKGLHIQNAIVPVFPVFVRRRTQQSDTE